MGTMLREETAPTMPHIGGTPKMVLEWDCGDVRPAGLKFQINYQIQIIVNFMKSSP
jgi:uncharacterized Zn finger protein